MARVALYTTIFPQSAEFLPAWYESVVAQSDTDFTLCVGLDSMSCGHVFKAAGATFDARWFFAPEGASPAQVRNGALLDILDDFDAVIFVDSDDVLKPTRVQAAKHSLRGADVSCCAMQIIDEHGQDTAVVFDPRGKIDHLERVNVLGFTNSAYRTSLLRKCLPVPDNCILMDWYVATTAHFAGARITCDSGIQMAYRQYEANTARVLSPFRAEQVLRAARLVLGHYDCLLLQEGASLDRVEMMRARTEVESFLRTLDEDEGVLSAYVEALNRLNIDHVWWSFVAHPSLEDIWKN